VPPTDSVEHVYIFPSTCADSASTSLDQADASSPPSLEAIVPVARKLSGSCEDQCGVQHLAVLAFWYLLLGVAQRKRCVYICCRRP
jgi:hypothetical protein